MSNSVGIGSATLMRVPSEQERLRLLHIAYDNGIRLVDTAPLYGLGTAEELIGKFAQGRDGVRVQTKIGLLPNARARMLRGVQGPLRGLVKALPSVRGMAGRMMSGGARSTGLVDANQIHRGVEQSLRRLRRDYIDSLLIHDRGPADVADEAVEALLCECKRGRVRTVGLAGSSALLAEWAGDGRFTPGLLQCPSPILEGEVSTGFNRVHYSSRESFDQEGPSVMYYGVVSAIMPALRGLFKSKPDLLAAARELFRPMGDEIDLGLVSCSLHMAILGGGVLVGTTSQRHVPNVALIEGGRSALVADKSLLGELSSVFHR